MYKLQKERTIVRKANRLKKQIVGVFNNEERSALNEHFIERINEFIESEEDSCSFDMRYSDLVPIYTQKKLARVRKKIEKLLEYESLIASIRQRRKKSRMASYSHEEIFQNTWDEGDICKGLISWFTGNSTPSIKVNVNPIVNNRDNPKENKDKYVSFWDGESKFQTIFYFLSDLVSDELKIWKVLDSKGNFVTEVDEFIKNPIKFLNVRLNEQRVRLLTNALNSFKSSFNKANPKYHITRKWLIDNQYQELITALWKHKTTVVLQDLTEEQEGNAYSREGDSGAVQSKVQLTEAKVESSWGKHIRYDDTKTPSDTFTIAMVKGVLRNSASPFYSAIRQNSLPSTDDNEQGTKFRWLDDYIYDFIFSNLINFVKEDVFYGFREDKIDFRGMSRPYDHGTQIVDDKITEFNQYISNLSESDKDSFIKKIKDLFNLVQAIMGYDGKNENLGWNNSEIQKIFKNSRAKDALPTIKQNLTSKIQELQIKYGIGDKFKKGIGKIDNLYIERGDLLTNYISLYIISYVFQDSNLKSQHITQVLQKVLDMVNNEWAEYLFTYEVPLSNTIFEPWTKEEWVEIVKNYQNLDLNDDKPMFGLMYAEHQGNLEKIHWIFNQFWLNKIKPNLDSHYGGVVSTARYRTEFEYHLFNRGKDKNKWFILDTVNEPPRYLKHLDMGHPLADALGGLLYRGQVLPEERDHNRNQFRTNDKKDILFHRCIMANINDRLAKLKELQSTLDFSELLSKGQELNEAKDNLKLWLEFLNQARIPNKLEPIEYDETASYINGTVKLEEYTNLKK